MMQIDETTAKANPLALVVLCWLCGVACRAYLGEEPPLSVQCQPGIVGLQCGMLVDIISKSYGQHL
eukprot:12059272-Karenia_brevis.AAC.1